MKDEKICFKLLPCNYKKFWLLESNVTFLNHGSFGACPQAVLEVQTKLRNQLERQPLRFVMREFEELLDGARNKLAAFVGADAEELVFVPNATTGVNAVLRSLQFSTEDELLTTNHEYNACRNALNFIASRTGARVVVAKVPFPIESPQQVIAAVMDKVSPRTRLALLDHVTSQTGLIFPLQQLVSKLGECGVDTLIDGAHAPGMIPLNLQAIGATYYTGNFDTLRPHSGEDSSFCDPTCPDRIAPTRVEVESPEAFGSWTQVPVCPTVLKANFRMLIAAFQSLSSTNPHLQT